MQLQYKLCTHLQKSYKLFDFMRHHLRLSQALQHSESEQLNQQKVGTKIRKCCTFPPQSNNPAKAFAALESTTSVPPFSHARDVGVILREAPDGWICCSDVHPLHLAPLPRPFARATRLVWSHSLLNVPSANISTFLRLKSIAIIFLRPRRERALVHAQREREGRETCRCSSFCFQLPFILIPIFV